MLVITSSSIWMDVVGSIDDSEQHTFVTNIQ